MKTENVMPNELENHIGKYFVKYSSGKYCVAKLLSVENKSNEETAYPVIVAQYIVETGNQKGQKMEGKIVAGCVDFYDTVEEALEENAEHIEPEMEKFEIDFAQLQEGIDELKNALNVDYIEEVWADGRVKGQRWEGCSCHPELVTKEFTAEQVKKSLSKFVIIKENDW